VKASRSLLWRLGALALGVTLLSLVLHVVVISVWIGPLANQMFAQLASRAKLTRALIEATPPARREAVVQSMATPPEFRVLSGIDPSGVRPSFVPPIGPNLVELLGPGFELRHEPTSLWSFERRLLFIHFVADGQPWRIEVQAQPPIQAVLGTGAGWLVLAALAVATSLLIGLRFIVGPIRQVAARIAEQGAAMQSLMPPAGASAEVHSLVESFNRLVERVQAADRTKQHLLAGVSHDLRTPLARLRLRIETQCEPRVIESAEEELRAVERIVSQFLAYVQGEGRLLPGPEQSVYATLEEAERSYAQQGVRIELVIEAPDARTGAVELRRVVTNLVDNAVAHGRPPFRLTWRAPQPGQHELGVWDAGGGLTAEEFRAALEPFVRLSQGGGLGHCGLGLAIVAQIAAQWQAALESRHDAEGRFGVVLTWHALRR
jgi:two-component system, OmpR family, osmolarity sensor histidine kinase EnvZ